jgi:hypothetical protein
MVRLPVRPIEPTACRPAVLEARTQALCTFALPDQPCALSAKTLLVGSLPASRLATSGWASEQLTAFFEKPRVCAGPLAPGVRIRVFPVPGFIGSALSRGWVCSGPLCVHIYTQSSHGCCTEGCCWTVLGFQDRSGPDRPHSTRRKHTCIVAQTHRSGG